MTEQMAIEVLKENRLEHYYINIDEYKEIDVAVRNMAIQALNEIQQIKEVLKDFPFDCGSTVSDVKEMHLQLNNYLKIGSLGEFKALKEKAEPKKPITREIPKTSWTRAINQYICPSCNMVISFGGSRNCSCCGQHLNWE